ncbi:alpha/beta hydrolase [Streptomyces sp. NPDC020379]|uniref:alpha/beta hydrolase n=1 Tax=Streptomyces sp. NPDC020379 TaxID=3365071 RepID=UPI0037AE746A
METEVTRTTTRTSLGKAVDAHRPAHGGRAPLPAVLFWHGIGADEREILYPVAEAVAAAGAVVFTPDWSAPEHLLDSLEFVHREAARHGADPARLVLAGWSAGAGAAVALAAGPGPRPIAVIGIAGRYDVPARTTGTPPLTDLPGAPPVPVHLVHGTNDTAVAADHSRAFASALSAHGWPVRLWEPASDHAGVLFGVYDEGAGRVIRSGTEAARRGGEATVEAIVTAVG